MQWLALKKMKTDVVKTLTEMEQETRALHDKNFQRGEQILSFLGAFSQEMFSESQDKKLAQQSSVQTKLQEQLDANEGTALQSKKAREKELKRVEKEFTKTFKKYQKAATKELQRLTPLSGPAAAAAERAKANSGKKIYPRDKWNILLTTISNIPKVPPPKPSQRKKAMQTASKKLVAQNYKSVSVPVMCKRLAEFLAGGINNVSFSKREQQKEEEEDAVVEVLVEVVVEVWQLWVI